MAKRRKMNWYDLVDRGLQWSAFSDDVLHEPTGTKGSMYHDVAFIMQWKNTLVTKGHYRYTPNNEVDCVFIAYKCIR